jgi:hypothetical protein
VFVPLLVGVLLLAPQQEYFIQTSKGRFTGSLIEFYPFFSRVANSE